MRHMAFALLLASSLLGCTQQQVTEFRGPELRSGFVEERLDGSRYRLSFRGAAGTPRETVEETALHRAAELAQTVGEEKFAVLDRLIERQLRVEPVAVRIRDFDLRDCRDARGSGFPERTLVLNQENFTYRETVAYTASLVVQPFSGAPPDGAFQIYDASEVLTTSLPSGRQAATAG